MTGPGSDSHAAYYPIRVVSAETGINAITLRAWERRYGLIEPKRTAKGHRLYTEQDIDLIRRVVSLLNRGIPISQAQAMLNGDIPHDDTPTPAAATPSRWQQYRELLYKAVQEFDDSALANLYEETGRYFPLEMSLRFLFIPLYYQMLDGRGRELGEARLAFYSAFIEARLGVRLSEQQIGNDRARVLMLNLSEDSSTSLLLLGVLLGRMETGITLLKGMLGVEQLQELILSQRKWPALIIQTARHPDADRLRQLKTLSIETGCPLFVSGPGTEYAQSLRDHGLIPLDADIQQAALTVRDIVQELSA